MGAVAPEPIAALASYYAAKHRGALYRLLHIKTLIQPEPVKCNKNYRLISMISVLDSFRRGLGTRTTRQTAPAGN